MVAMAALVDRFGFALVGLSAEETRTRGASAARETTMANKWTKVDTISYDPAAQPAGAPSKALKALVRGGIPSALRPDMWLRFSGAPAKKAAAPAGFYPGLQRRMAIGGSVDAAELGAELARAFGTHPLLSSVKGMRSVLRMLEGYHLLRPGKMGLGRSRGMACIAAFVLVVMGPEREEDAFWTFVGLVEDRVPHSCVVENVKGPGVEQRVLRALLAKRCPKVITQLERAETPLEEVTASWFHTLFCTALPAETVVRIWDVLLLEGPKILFRVALALFKLNEGALLSAKMSAHVSRTVKWRIARCYDADALFKVAFSGIGSLPMSVIKRARADYEGIVQEELVEHRRRLQAVLSPPKNADGTSPTSSEGSPVHLSTIYEEDTDAAFAMYEAGESEECESKAFSGSSFLGGFLQPLRAVTG